MFIIRIAELNIKINNKYQYVETICKDYLVDFNNFHNNDIDFEVSVSDEELLKEQQLGKFSKEYCESMCTYRNIVMQIIRYDAIFIHASVVALGNNAFAFLAKSGTGKTTHTNLWLEYFKGDARIINGDKPILRFKDNELYVYGTPWCGKEGYNINTSSKLRAMCFLERDEVNSIRAMAEGEFVTKLFHQVILPKDTTYMDMFLSLVNRLVDIVPMYILKCNISEEAVTTAYNTLKKYMI